MTDDISLNGSPAWLFPAPRDNDEAVRQARDLLARQQADEAERLLERVLAEDPRHAPAVAAMADLARLRGNVDSAARGYELAARLQPRDAESAFSLGYLLHQQGKVGEAEKWYAEAIARDPPHAAAHNNLAAICLGRGDVAAAMAHFRLAVRRDPDNVEARYNLGHLALTSGDAALAEESLRAVLVRRPEHPEANLELARLLIEQQRDFPDVVRCAQAVLNGDPEQPEANRLQGIAFGYLGDARRAVAPLAKAFLASGRTDWVAAMNLAIYLNMLPPSKGILAVLRDVADSFPEDVNALLGIVRGKMRALDWEGLPAYLEAFLRALDRDPEARLGAHALVTIPGCGPDRQLAYAASYARSLVERMGWDTGGGPAAAGGPDGGDRRLNIGYFSSDFRDHATSYLMAGIFAQHDRERFRVHAFSFKEDPASPMQARIQGEVEVWHGLEHADAEARLRAIREAELDIAVDLNGWTLHSWRFLLPTQRVAPVVASWLGYPGTLGLPELADYLVGDPWVTPPGHAGHFSETLALLPHSYQPNDARREIGPAPDRAGAGLPADGFVFCSFNQNIKLTPEMFDIWCRLLREVPGSVLWLLEPGEFGRANLAVEAEKRGVSADRLVYAPQLPHSAHLGRLGLADLALDTLPCNSHTTGSDALWAGVPMVTCPGDTFAGRVGASLVAAAGLPELIARDLEEYRRLALDLARDRPRLESLRARLRDGRRTVPLFDTVRFTRDLERLYRRMWDDHRAGRKEAIVLAAEPADGERRP